MRPPWLAACVCRRARTGSTRGLVERWRDWHLCHCCEGVDHVVWVGVNDPHPPNR